MAAGGRIGITIAIADARSDAAALAALLADNLTTDYISHSELQGRRAIAVDRWASDVRAVLRREIEERLADARERFPDGGDWHGVVEVRDDGAVIGVALVAIARGAAVPYGIIEDIVIAPSWRGRGQGEAVLRWIEGRFRDAGIARVFLESGVRNPRAHRLFQRLGFEAVSIVMMKDL